MVRFWYRARIRVMFRARIRARVWKPSFLEIVSFPRDLEVFPTLHYQFIMSDTQCSRLVL